MRAIQCNGFLWIGDPHATARRPGRRRDMSFLKTSLNKLEQAIQIANECDYVPMILGDLLHYDREYSVDINNELLVGLMNVLSLSVHKPYCLTGNHDFGSESRLDTNKNMSVLKASRLVHVIENTKGIGIFDIHGQLYGVGGTPSGKEIPDSVSGFFPDEVSKIFWMTHEDLAFPGSYPGAKAFFEIEDCDTVINGHMHLEQPIHQEGKTRWFNPGNILRMSVDAETHEPAVWSWTPDDDLTKIVLQYEADIFNKDDIHTVSNNDEMLSGSIKDLFDESAFVRSLKEEEGDMAQSADGSGLKVSLDAILAGKKVSKGAELMVRSLLNLSLNNQERGVSAVDELKKLVYGE